QLGTPCVTGVRGIVDALDSGVQVAIDGTSGWLEAPGTPVPAPDPSSAPDGLVPILQFGRFSSAFECTQAELTPEFALRIAALAMLPAALGDDRPLELGFDGNRVLAPGRRLRELADHLADRLEAEPARAAALRAGYDHGFAWLGWRRPEADLGRAIEHFVQLNCLTWVAGLAKEDLAARLRRQFHAQLPEPAADEALLLALTTRGTSYLLDDARLPGRPPAPSTSPAAASGDVEARAQALRHLIAITELKNTRLARLAVAVRRLPIATALGLPADDGTDAGRATMLRRAVGALPKVVLPL
ncbi:MAG: hypothetical protein KIT69_03090, partial [Propionibacteriaceae bacterium]|nr:hypothetical protein [Propionibacteriaceae bacterium]